MVPTASSGLWATSERDVPWRMPQEWWSQHAAANAADPHPTRRIAFTLAELLVVLAVFGVLFAIAVLRVGAAADRTAVRAATAEAATTLQSARNAAIYRRAPVAVFIDTLRATLLSRADTEVLARRDLWLSYGVRLTATRDSMAFDARGLGIGAANLSLIARRGRFADTLFVSRLGRLRH
jgi:prepilin-type N-terminal cleavage/methylation domain-containing protein